VTTTPTTVYPSAVRARADIIHTFRYAYAHQPELAAAAVGTTVAYLLVGWWWRRWKRRRRDAETAWSAPVGRAIHDPVTVTKVTRRDGRIVYMRCRYRPDAVLHGPGFTNLQANLADQLGVPIRVDTDKTRRVIHLRLEQPAGTEPQDVGQVAKIEKVAHQLLSPDAAVTGTVAADGRFDRFTVTHSTIHDAEPELRRKVDATMQAKLGQRLQSYWETDRYRVTYRAVPDLPALVPHPIDRPAAGYEIPFAVDANGNTVAWDLDSATPHVMVAGSTGGGKTVTVHSLLTELTRRGIEVRVCDPKLVSFLGFETWPNVTVLATETDTIAATILATRADLEARYRAIKNRDTTEDDLTPIVLILDEAWEALATMNAAWRQQGEKGDSPAFTAFGEIARLGRQCRIHLIAAFQRPDAKIIGGETRANFGCRILAGRGKTETVRMLEFATNVTSRTRGRAVVDVGDGELEAQIYYTPDPRRAAKLTAADRAILDGLRPAVRAPAFHVTPRPEPVLAPVVPFRPRLVAAPAEPPDAPADPPEPTLPARVCVTCKQTDVEFGRDRSRADGLSLRCKGCERERIARARAAKRVPVDSTEKGP
jgi:hypothetical protein